MESEPVLKRNPKDVVDRNCQHDSATEKALMASCGEPPRVGEQEGDDRTLGSVQYYWSQTDHGACTE
jgi:hypothetical protein